MGGPNPDAARIFEVGVDRDRRYVCRRLKTAQSTQSYRSPGCRINLATWSRGSVLVLRSSAIPTRHQHTQPVTRIIAILSPTPDPDCLPYSTHIDEIMSASPTEPAPDETRGVYVYEEFNSHNDYSGEEDEDEDEDEDEGKEEIEEDMQLANMFPGVVIKMQGELLSSAMEQSPELQAQFINKYQRFLRRQTEIVQDRVTIEDRNFLYRMARDNTRAPWLIEYLAENYPQLLYEADDADRGALLIAVTKDRRDFIKSVLDSNIEDIHLNKALASCGFNSENCIHLAVSKRSLEPELVIRMIEKASEDTLATRDLKGLTPLHRAVDYARCTSTQIGVVKALIKYGDRALDETTGKPDELSVYRYHVDTRRKYKEGAQKVERKPKSTKSSSTARSTAHAKPPQGTHQGADSSASRQGNLGADRERKERGTELGRDRHGAEKKRQDEEATFDEWERVRAEESSLAKERKATEPSAPSFQKPNMKRAQTRELDNPFISMAVTPITKVGLPLPLLSTAGPRRTAQPDQPQGKPEAAAVPLPRSGEATPDDRRSTQEGTAGSKLKRPKLAIAGSKSKSSKSIREATEAPSPEAADAIAKELKLHYLRTTFSQLAEIPDQQPKTGKPRVGKRRTARTHNSAVEFLYGENKEGTSVSSTTTMRLACSVLTTP